MTERGKQPTTFEEFDRKTQQLIRTVGETMQFPQYKQIFSSYERKYVLPKFVCYYVLYERGLSFPQIGRKFKRNHTSIMHAIDKAKNIPECMIIANTVNTKLKKIEEQEAVIDRYRTGVEKSKYFEKIKSLLNSGMNNEEICQKIGIPLEKTNEIIQLIKKKCKLKSIPDYKNCVIKKIYI